MSEQDTDISRRLEIVLLDQLARKEERICMLEALLEETRRKAQPTEHEARAEPELPRARAYRAESGSAGTTAEPAILPVPFPVEDRKPITLPEFGGQGIDAIAEAVRTTAAARIRPSEQPDSRQPFPDAQIPFAAENHATAYASPDYEPTMRFHAPPVRRREQGEEFNRRRFPVWKAGSLVLLSLAIAALSAGVRQRQSALLYASTPVILPLPPVAPPKPLRQSGWIIGATPIVEPVSAPPKRFAASHSVVSHAAPKPRRPAPAPVHEPRLAQYTRHAAQTDGAVAPAAASAIIHRQTAPVSPDRQAKEEIQSHFPARFDSQPPLADRAEAPPPEADNLPLDPEDTSPVVRRQRRIAGVATGTNFAARSRRLTPHEISEELRRVNRDTPRRETQESGHRAMRTPDDMQELPDSMERGKRHNAETNAE